MPNIETKYMAIKALLRGWAERSTRPPAVGWLRAIREAIGMTRPGVALRMGVTPAAVQFFERADAAGNITVASMRKMAAAMDCDVVISFVPRGGVTLFDLAAGHDPEMKPFQEQESAAPIPGQGFGGDDCVQGDAETG